MRVTVRHRGEEFSSAMFPDQQSCIRVAAMLELILNQHPDYEVWEVIVGEEEAEDGK